MRRVRTAKGPPEAYDSSAVLASAAVVTSQLIVASSSAGVSVGSDVMAATEVDSGIAFLIRVDISGRECL